MLYLDPLNVTGLNPSSFITTLRLALSREIALFKAWGLFQSIVIVISCGGLHSIVSWPEKITGFSLTREPGEPRWWLIKQPSEVQMRFLHLLFGSRQGEHQFLHSPWTFEAPSKPWPAHKEMLYDCSSVLSTSKTRENRLSNDRALLGGLGEIRTRVRDISPIHFLPCVTYSSGTAIGTSVCLPGLRIVNHVG